MISPDRRRGVGAVRFVIALGIGLLLTVVIALALIQRLHLYPGLARLWG